MTAQMTVCQCREQLWAFTMNVAELLVLLSTAVRDINYTRITRISEREVDVQAIADQ